MTSTIQPNALEHPFAQYVRILGKGKTGTRSLSREEARDAFSLILNDEVDPLQLGAFLMLLRVKEETAQELAGFVDACRAHITPAMHTSFTPDLDWSSYAGKKHQHPWYILAMLLLTQAGYTVFIHGSSGHTPGRLYTEQAFYALGLPIAQNWQDAENQLTSTGLSYMPLRHFCEPLDRLLHLRSLLGLRSPVNTLARLLNPLGAPCAIQSIFHPAYAALHQEADLFLNQPNALVYKGDSGEIEIKPHADTRLLYLRQGDKREQSLPRTISHRVSPVESPCAESIRHVWRDSAQDNYGLNATLATTAVALTLLRPGTSLETAKTQAAQLWNDRDKKRLNECP